MHFHKFHRVTTKGDVARTTKVTEGQRRLIELVCFAPTDLNFTISRATVTRVFNQVLSIAAEKLWNYASTETCSLKHWSKEVGNRRNRICKGRFRLELNVDNKA